MGFLDLVSFMVVGFVWVLWFDGMRNTTMNFLFFLGDIFRFFPTVMLQ